MDIVRRVCRGSHSVSLACWAAALGLIAAGPVAGQPAPVDPPPPPARVLTLADCIGLAMENSPTLSIAQERRHIAAKDVSDAYGAFLPDVSLGRNWNKSERTDYDIQQYSSSLDTFLTTDSGFDTTQWVAQVTAPAGVADQVSKSSYTDWSGRASLNLFNGFASFSSLGAAKNNLKSADATLGYTRELLVEDVITAYFNLLRYEQLKEVAVETREQAAKELEKTETYFRLGSAAKSAVLQQRVRLENTKLDVVVAGNNVKKAFVDLAYLMNQPLADEFAVDRSVLRTDYQVEDVEALYAQALAGRLDLAGTEFSLQARRQDVTTATGNLWPQINLSAGYTRYNNESPYKFGGQISENTSYGYSITWNVFDRMQTINGRSKAKANVRIAEYELEQARLNAQVEIRQLHNGLVEARERANVSRETIEQSNEELRLAQERFRVGAGTALDVIMAQVNLANSRAQEVQAVCDFLIAKAQLDRAVGRLSRWTSGP